MKRKRVYFLILLLIIFIGSFVYKRKDTLTNKATGSVIANCYTKGFTPLKEQVCTTYNKNGKISTIERRFNDKIDGLISLFYDNEQIQFVAEYKSDKIWNIIKYYSENGNKFDFGTLKNGEGILKCYNSDGDLRSEGLIKNGFKEGYWKFYNNVGLSDSVLYISGRKEGDEEIDNNIY